MYKIYDLLDYKISKNNENDFDNNDKCKKFEGILEEVCKELELKKGYNMRLRENDKVILFGDLDGYKKDIKIFMNEIKEYLSEKGLEINLEEDFYFTENNGYEKEGKSYHYSIPKYNGNIKNIKKLVSEFKRINKYENEIDTSIYCDRWWRLPNQKKNNKKGTEHIIQKGEMKDFIVTYIKVENLRFSTPLL